MPSKRTRVLSLKRALDGVNQETERVRDLISNAQLPLQVGEKVLQGLAQQRESIIEEMEKISSSSQLD